jgi:hypothetical protein
MRRLRSSLQLLTFFIKFIDDASGKLGFLFPNAHRTENTQLENCAYIIQVSTTTEIPTTIGKYWVRIWSPGFLITQTHFNFLLRYA